MIESISRERLVALLESARGRSIAVIGDAMLDVYLRGDLDGEDMENLLAAAMAAAERADALIFEDYNKGLLTASVIAPVIERARERKIPTVVDPKYRNFFAYRGATMFKPNRRELESAF